VRLTGDQRAGSVSFVSVLSPVPEPETSSLQARHSAPNHRILAARFRRESRASQISPLGSSLGSLSIASLPWEHKVNGVGNAKVPSLAHAGQYRARRPYGGERLWAFACTMLRSVLAGTAASHGPQLGLARDPCWRGPLMKEPGARPG
jgi:hypothetical protein